jgi:hypothetical protein
VSQRRVYFMGSVPKCFDSAAQYAEWRDAARMAKVGALWALGPCIDCTPKYQGEMVKQRRCENQNVRFRMVEVREGNQTEMELQGYFPVIEKEKKIV